MIKGRKNESYAEAQDIRNSAANVVDEQCGVLFLLWKNTNPINIRISGKMRMPWHKN